MDESVETPSLLSALNGLERASVTGLAWSEMARISKAIASLDHFKAFNDTNGHPAGDQLLKDAANRWREQLRPGDLLARIGGEEFAVLLPGCRQTHAINVLDRLRTATPAATCSIGLAQHKSNETATELTARADSALYTAKHQGRNRLIAA